MALDDNDRGRLLEQQIEAVKRAMGQAGVGGGRANTSTIPTNFEQGRTRAPSTGIFTAPSSTSIQDLLEDIPELPEDPDEPTSPEDIIAQAFAGWDAFIEQVLQYIEDQASDDIDRVFLMEELQQLEDLFSQYEAGQITAEEFLEFEPDLILDAPGATEYWETLKDKIYTEQETVLGDPGQIDEDTTQSPVETIFEDDGTITTIIDPTLITLPPLLGDPEIESDEGGGSSAPEEREEETEAADTVIPDYSDLVSPEFEVPEPPGETGIPDFYEVDEEGTVTTVLDPDNPLDPARVPEHVDVDTPGTYPENGYVRDEQDETVTSPAPSGPDIVIAPSLPGGLLGGGADGTDQISTGGDGGGTGTGQGTGDGEGSGDGTAPRQGMFDPRFTPYMSSIGYTPVAVPQLIGPVKKDYDVAIDGLFGRLLG